MSTEELSDRISENRESVQVSQDSLLGSLGLSALLRAGYCGPNYDLSDLSVSVHPIGNGYAVDFYDMSCMVCEDNDLYKDINEVFKNYKSGGVEYE